MIIIECDASLAFMKLDGREMGVASLRASSIRVSFNADKQEYQFLTIFFFFEQVFFVIVLSWVVKYMVSGAQRIISEKTNSIYT